jgi:hypothetical protein
MWSGVIGLSTTLEVFDAGDAVGNSTHLSDAERVAFANYMIDLWSKFRDESDAKVPTTNAEGPIAAAAEEPRNHYGNPEEQICDLMRAADLCAYLTADWLTEGRTAPASNSLYIYLPDDFAERLIFVADEVRTRVGALKKFYYDDGFEARSPAKRAE